MAEESNEEAIESFKEIFGDLHQVIDGMRDKIGRLPTNEEVTAFIFADNDDIRQKILDDAKAK